MSSALSDIARSLSKASGIFTPSCPGPPCRSSPARRAGRVRRAGRDRSDDDRTAGRWRGAQARRAVPEPVVVLAARDPRHLSRAQPGIWSAVYHNPVALLQRMDANDIARRVQNLEMQTRINQAHRRLREYLDGVAEWAIENAGPLLARPVAYFSAEF